MRWQLPDYALAPVTSSRPLRMSGAIHHVALRRADGDLLFRSPADRSRFDQCVGDLLHAYAARAHAYCWMTNHVHLALEIEPDRAARFQNDIAAVLGIDTLLKQPIRVDARIYLLRLVRYIHLNPVVAGLATDPADWPWSGHRVYLGEPGVPWLCVQHALRLLGGDLLVATATYRDYVRGFSEPWPRSADHERQLSRGALPQR